MKKQYKNIQFDIIAMSNNDIVTVSGVDDTTVNPIKTDYTDGDTDAGTSLAPGRRYRDYDLY